VNVNVFAAFTELSEESIWTFRSDRPDHYASILSTILDDANRNATRTTRARPCVVVAESYWNQKPLEYLTSWRADVKIELLDPRMLEEHSKDLVEALERGSYVVSYHSDSKVTDKAPIPRRLAEAFRPGELRQWEFEDARHNKILSVYRLEPSPDILLEAERTPGGASPVLRR
jgi:hypothetical protein